MLSEIASLAAALHCAGVMAMPGDGTATPGLKLACLAEPVCAGRPQVELLTTASEIEAVAAEWLELETRSASPAFFQSLGWCRHIMRELGSVDAGTGGKAVVQDDKMPGACPGSFPGSHPGRGADRSRSLRPIVATAREAGRLIAVWPLNATSHLGGRFLTSMGAPFDQYGEILLDRDADHPSVLTSMVERLRQIPGIDGLLLRKVRAGGTSEKLIALGARVIDEGNAAPWLRFDAGKSFDTFHQRINAKTRKNLRNLNNRLGRLGRLEHRILSGDDIPFALRASFARRQDWLQAQGLSSSAFRDPRFSAVVEGLAKPEAQELGLIVFALHLDDKIIALQWGFIHKGRYYAFLSAKDPAYDSYSAGRVHLEHVLRACHELGVREVDLLVPAVPYKMTWTDDAASVRDLYWAWSSRGRLILDVFDGRLRPALKRVVEQLPEAVRKRLFAAAAGAA